MDSQNKTFKKPAWTDDEKELVLELYLKGLKSIEIRDELDTKFHRGRSVYAINKIISAEKQRTKDMLLKLVPWSDDELLYLYQLYNERKSYQTIANRLNAKFHEVGQKRSPSSVTHGLKLVYKRELDTLRCLRKEK